MVAKSYWKTEEDRLLVKIVNTNEYQLDWSKVAKELSNKGYKKNSLQCKDR